MPWPLSQDYNEAIQDPRSALADPDLREGQPVTGPLGVPMPRSGNFADVYEFLGANGNRYAIKCFTREVPGLRDRYSEISKCLAQLKLPFMVDFQYQDRGICIRDQWYPVLKMQWVEGFLLNEFVRNNLDKPNLLEGLCQIWVRMGKRLREAGIAHADLQHGNVILVPGSSASMLAVRLIDYDGMWVPALAQKKSGELGHACYQHPQRQKDRIYSAEVDRLPLLAIACALRCLAVGGKALWDRFDTGDNMLFQEADLRDPGKSPLFKVLWNLPDAAAHDLVGYVTMGLAGALDWAPLLPAVMPEAKPRPLNAEQEAKVTGILGPGAKVSRTAVVVPTGRKSAVRAGPPPVTSSPNQVWADIASNEEQPAAVVRAERTGGMDKKRWLIAGAGALCLAIVAIVAFSMSGTKGGRPIAQIPPGKPKDGLRLVNPKPKIDPNPQDDADPPIEPPKVDPPPKIEPLPIAAAKPRLAVFFDYSSNADEARRQKITQTFNFGIVRIEDPANPAKWTRLTYDPRGQTNSTVVRIDDTDRMIGKSEAGSWADAPKVVPGGMAGTWLFPDNVRVTQMVQTASRSLPGKESSQAAPDTCLIRFTIENRDTDKHNIGLRLVLDTMIGNNDKPAHVVPGRSDLLTGVSEFNNEGVPRFIELLEHPDVRNPGIVTRMTFRSGPVKLPEGPISLETPSRVRLTEWPGNKSLAVFDIPLMGIKSDSAVVVFWKQEEMNPGATRTLGFSISLQSNTVADPKPVVVADPKANPQPPPDGKDENVKPADDRSVALWALDHGCTVGIKTNEGKLVYFYKRNQPADAWEKEWHKPFTLNAVLIQPNSQITDADLQRFAWLIDLSSLNIYSSLVTDAGLAHLKGLNRLKHLQLMRGPFTDAGLAALPPMPSIEALLMTEVPATGSWLKHLDRFPRLKHLSLFQCPINDAGLEEVGKCSHGLQTLNLIGTKITDAGLAHLKGLKMLRVLQLNDTKVSDTSLTHIGTIPSLATLDLTNTPVSDAGLAYLKGINLRNLILTGTNVTDRGLEFVKGVPHLKLLRAERTKVSDAGLAFLETVKLHQLDVGNTRITDTGMKHLRQQTELRHVGLERTEISDEGLAELKGLSTIQSINLKFTKITDKGISHLHELRSLLNLSLGGTQVSAAAIDELKKSLPKCQVIK